MVLLAEIYRGLCPHTSTLHFLNNFLLLSFPASVCSLLRIICTWLLCNCWLFQCSRSVSSGPVEACTVQVSDPGSASTPPSWEVRHDWARTHAAIMVCVCCHDWMWWVLTIKVIFRNIFIYSCWLFDNNVYIFGLLFLTLRYCHLQKLNLSLSQSHPPAWLTGGFWDETKQKSVFPDYHFSQTETFTVQDTKNTDKNQSVLFKCPTDQCL